MHVACFCFELVQLWNTFTSMKSSYFSFFILIVQFPDLHVCELVGEIILSSDFQRQWNAPLHRMIFLLHAPTLMCCQSIKNSILASCSVAKNIRFVSICIGSFEEQRALMFLQQFLFHSHLWSQTLTCSYRGISDFFPSYCCWLLLGKILIGVYFLGNLGSLSCRPKTEAASTAHTHHPS